MFSSNMFKKMKPRYLLAYALIILIFLFSCYASLCFSSTYVQTDFIWLSLLLLSIFIKLLFFEFLFPLIKSILCQISVSAPNKCTEKLFILWNKFDQLLR